MIEIEDRMLSIDDILLDPINPRFGLDREDIQLLQFNDRKIQLNFLEKLKRYEIEGLIESIFKKWGYINRTHYRSKVRKGIESIYSSRRK